MYVTDLAGRFIREASPNPIRFANPDSGPHSAVCKIRNIHAAAQGQSLADIEKAFLDSAYHSVQAKAAPIMKAPYRVGFEIVQHNDDNTRLVGIFVFRVNKDLYFAPVFFINGSIKGTDLFYRHSTKSFVPLNEKWLEYLISLSESSEGKGVPISERTNTRRQLNLQNIVSPPSVMTNPYKYASTDPAPGELKQLVTEFWNEIKSAAIPELPTDSILRRFIVNDGGFNAIKKIAAAAQSNKKFAEALCLASKPENYMPEIDPVKSASAPEPWLTIHFDPLHNPATKSASADDLHKGYVIDNQRPKEAVNEFICDANERNLQSVTQPGVYKVLVADGSTREMIAAYHRKLLAKEHYHSGIGSSSIMPFVLVETDTKKSKELDLFPDTKTWRVLGMFDKELSPDLGEAKPTANKLYRVLNLKSKSISDAVWVEKVSDGDLGLTQVTFNHGYSSKPETLTINPDFTGCDPMDKILGNCCRWLEVKKCEDDLSSYNRADDSIELGDIHAINEFIYRQGFLKAAVQKTTGDRYIVWLEANKQNTPGAYLSKLAAKCALMTHCALKEAEADDSISAADQKGRFLFLYEPAERLATKVAHNLRFPQFPEFYDTMNSDYNVQEQPAPTRILVQAERDLSYVEKHRIGDKMTFDAGDNLDTATPMQLYQKSQERGVGSPFEHGVVGSLVS